MLISPTVTAAGVGIRVNVLEDPGQHVGAVGGQGELEQRPGEAAARLDQRDQAAAGHVQALQGALEVVHDLVDEPVAAVVKQQLIVGQHPPRVAAVWMHPGAELEFVGAQVEDQVVERAGHGERPEGGALLVDRRHVRGRVLRPGR